MNHLTDSTIIKEILSQTVHNKLTKTFCYAQTHQNENVLTGNLSSIYLICI